MHDNVCYLSFEMPHYATLCIVVHILCASSSVIFIARLGFHCYVHRVVHIERALPNIAPCGVCRTLFFFRFKEEHEGVQIQERAFVKLRPYFVKPLKDRNVGACMSHIEVQMMMVAFN